MKSLLILACVFASTSVSMAMEMKVVTTIQTKASAVDQNYDGTISIHEPQILFQNNFTSIVETRNLQEELDTICKLWDKSTAIIEHSLVSPITDSVKNKMVHVTADTVESASQIPYVNGIYTLVICK